MPVDFNDSPTVGFLTTWVLTPSLVLGLLSGLFPLLGPGARWSRRLRNDLSIASALPEGAERERWLADADALALRLREYRLTLTPPQMFGRLVLLTLAVSAIAGAVIWPPINEPGDKYPMGPADYGMMLMGLYSMGLMTVPLFFGRDWQWRTPRQKLDAARERRFRQRRKAMDRLDRHRSELRKAGTLIPAKGTRLGFSTQIDPLAHIVRTWEARDIARFSGYSATGLDGDARRSLASKKQLAARERYLALRQNDRLDENHCDGNERDNEGTDAPPRGAPRG